MAADFGVHAMTLSRWMRRAEFDEGTKPGPTSQESMELREARRRLPRSAAAQPRVRPHAAAPAALQNPLPPIVPSCVLSARVRFWTGAGHRRVDRVDGRKT
ncbi:hypothetical protein [Streptomyces sp. NPDC002287]